MMRSVLTSRTVFALIAVVVFSTTLRTKAQPQEWVARYTGPGNGQDYVAAQAHDTAGNTCLTGYTSGTEDYLTVKIDSNGAVAWTAVYDGTGFDFDEATAIAVDAAGNVYVTGGSVGMSSAFDYATIKYDSAGQPPREHRLRQPRGH